MSLLLVLGRLQALAVHGSREALLREQMEMAAARPPPPRAYHVWVVNRTRLQCMNLIHDCCDMCHQGSQGPSFEL